MLGAECFDRIALMYLIINLSYKQFAFGNRCTSHSFISPVARLNLTTGKPSVMRAQSSCAVGKVPVPVEIHVMAMH